MAIDIRHVGRRYGPFQSTVCADQMEAFAIAVAGGVPGYFGSAQGDPHTVRTPVAPPTFGVTFAMGGTVDKPSFQMNPMSAVAPGFLRKFFEYSSRCEPGRPIKKTGKGAEEPASPGQ